MTIIAAKKEKNKIIVAADSQLTWGHDIKSVEGHNKIWKSNNIIYGHSGFASLGSLLYSYTTQTKLASNKQKDVIEFLVSFHDYVVKKDSNLKAMNDNYLFAINGKMIACFGLCVMITDKFTAVGSGAHLALGAFECGASAKRACEIACKHNINCSGKIITLNI